MANSDGFWSYVHKDDEHDRGRISQLARDLVGEYEMLTGDSIDLFLDKDALKWGDNWKQSIDISLASVAFFVPVLTPRYFASAECRRELTFFARQAIELGLNDLVLPLVWVSVPALLDEGVTDDLILLLRKFQWEDWKSLRHCEPTSEAYRRGLSRLAERLVAANRRAETAPQQPQPSGALATEPEGAGIVDILADGELAMPAMTEAIREITEAIAEVGRTVQQVASPLVDGNPTYQQRAAAATELAHKLEQPVGKMTRASDEFIAQLGKVDITIRTLVEMATTPAAMSPEESETLATFVDAIKFLALSSGEGLRRGEEFAAVLPQLERASRDMRPVVRKLRLAVTKLAQGRETTDGWLDLVSASEVTNLLRPSVEERPQLQNVSKRRGKKRRSKAT